MKKQEWLYTVMKKCYCIIVEICSAFYSIYRIAQGHHQSSCKRREPLCCLRKLYNCSYKVGKRRSLSQIRNVFRRFFGRRVSTWPAGVRKWPGGEFSFTCHTFLSRTPRLGFQSFFSSRSLLECIDSLFASDYWSVEAVKVLKHLVDRPTFSPVRRTSLLCEKWV